MNQVSSLILPPNVKTLGRFCGLAVSWWDWWNLTIWLRQNPPSQALSGCDRQNSGKHTGQRGSSKRCFPSWHNALAQGCSKNSGTPCHHAKSTLQWTSVIENYSWNSGKGTPWNSSNCKITPNILLLWCSMNYHGMSWKYPWSSWYFLSHVDALGCTWAQWLRQDFDTLKGDCEKCSLPRNEMVAWKSLAATSLHAKN